MTVKTTDFGKVADDLGRAAASFALLTSSATAFGASLGAFRELERQLVLTNAVALGTVETYNNMNEATRSFALATSATASEAAGALQNLAQAGFSAQESLQALTGVLLLSQATMEDVAITSDLISSNIRAFDLSTADTTRVSNLFAASITNSLASVDKLTFAMRQVAPVAKVANLSIEETTAFLNELFNVGLRGEQAGTALRNVIVRLTRPTGEAAKILREIGVATVDATGNFRGLQTVLSEIQAANLGEAKLATIFENEALAGALTLMRAVTKENDELTSSYERQLKAISNTQRALELALARLDSFDGAMSLLQNAMNEVGITIGETVAPAIRWLAEMVVDLVRGFRELSPAMQSIVTWSSAIVVGFVGMLAAVNAVILLFGTGAAAIGRFAIGLAGLAGTAVGMAKAAVVAGTLTKAFGALSAVVLALSGVIPLLGVGWGLFTVAFSAAAINPIVGGILAISAAAYGLYVGFGKLRDIAHDATSEIRDLAAVRLQRMESAQSFIDNVSEGVGDDLAFEELEARLKRADDLLNSGLIKVVADNDIRSAIQAANESQKQVVELGENLEESDDFLLDILDELSARRREFDKRAEQLPKIKLIDEFTGEITEQVDPAELAKLREEFGDIDLLQKTFRERSAKFEEAAAETSKIAEQGIVFEKRYIKQLLEQVKEGALEIDAQYSDVLPQIQTILSNLGKDAISRLADTLAQGDDPLTDIDLISAILLAEDPVANRGLVAQLRDRVKNERVRKFVTDLQSIADDLAAENEKARIALLEFLSEDSENFEEAMRAAIEAANANIEFDLSDAVEDFTDKYGKSIGEMISVTQEGISDIINDFLEKGGYSFDEIQGIEELFGGSGFVDAVRKRVDEDTTDEELLLIAAEEGERYRKIMLEMLVAIAEAMNGAISDEQLDLLTQIVEGQIQAIEDAIIKGARDSRTAQDSVTKRFEARTKEAERAAQDAMKKAKDRLAEMRKIEDELRGISDNLFETRRDIFDLTPNLGIDERLRFSIDFDIEDVNRQIDDQIFDLRRKFEDFAIDFKGPQEVLDKVRDGYAAMIYELERLREAQLAEIGTFEYAMERRSEAIDKFLTDLRNLSYESRDTFTSVGAGIASAFAEYQRELITLVDITQDATTDFLDTLSGGIADFIFDNENAWENFKESMLRISREVFEGFTRAFLQQAISSLTGGPGSILGNALQPSPYGREGIPSVGSGGLLGRLFPGLAGAFEGGQPAANPQQSIAQISASLQAGAAQMQQSYTTHISSINQVFTGFVTSLQAVLSRVIAGIQSIAGGEGTGILGTVTDTIGGIFGGPTTDAIGTVFEGMTGSFKTITDSSKKLVAGIIETAQAIGANPVDLATVISYETGGTFNPLQPGPTTKWGQHRGLIQFGVPQAAQYGADFSSFDAALNSQLGADGAIARYFRDRGYQPGMDLRDLYSTVNAGAPGRYTASDAAAGGRPNDVTWKVTNDMVDHMAKAENLLGNYVNSDLTNFVETSIPDVAQFQQQTGITSLLNPTQNVAPAPGVVTPQSAVGSVLGGNPAQGANPFAANAAAINQTLTAFNQRLVQVFNQFGTELASSLTAVTNAIRGMAAQVQSGGTIGFTAIGGGFGGGGASGGGGGWFFNFLSSLFSFADGGQIPIAVSNGETYIDPETTRKYFPLLEAINSGKIYGAGTGTSDSIGMLAQQGAYIVNAQASRKHADLLQSIVAGRNFAEGGPVLMETLPYRPAITAGASNRRTTDTQSGGRSTVVNVNYNVKINSRSDAEAFRKSAHQHARTLGGLMQNASRND